MSSWNSGYVADVPYLYGYYPELNPQRIALPLLRAGIKPPLIRSACELGFGQGVSMAINAASAPIDWAGNDFNPSHAAFAAGLAEEAQNRCRVFDDSFEQFARRVDLPQFDYIGLHGVWSWISDANRGVIKDFVRDRLRPGGVLYISYNVLPGWSSFAPIRQMMYEFAEQTQGALTDSATRVGNALDFVEQFFAVNPTLKVLLPNAAERFKTVKDQSRHYLAHEYFNRDWRPMYFGEIAEMLIDAKLEFAGSAHYHDHVDGLNLTPDQAKLLAAQPNWRRRESLRDFVTCQQFRRDYWIKGAVRLSPLEQQAALAAQRVILTAPPGKIPLKTTALLGEATLTESVYRPVIDILSDHKPWSLGDMAEALKGKVAFGQISEAVMVLAGSAHAAPVVEDQALPLAEASARRLNRKIIEQTRSGGEIVTLASPVLGGGLPTDRFEQIFAEAVWQGHQEPEAMARHALSYLMAQRQRIVSKGKLLATDAENEREILDRATAFVAERLPVFRALKIA